MFKKSILVLAVLSSFISIASAASVGAVPGFIEIENLESGDQVERTIYITTNLEDEFALAPSASSTTSNRIVSGASDPDRVSEQGSEDWFNLEQTVVDPSSSESETVSDNTIVNAEGEFLFELEVPQNAEPGTHYGAIRLNPDIGAGDDGAGATTFGQTRITYRLVVEGQANRDIRVQDVRGFRTDSDAASVEVLLNNQGTVTTSVDDFQIDVINEAGDKVSSLQLGGIELSPGEAEWTNANWRDEQVEEGSYQIDGEVDYITGNAFASGGFSLSDVVEVVPEDSPEVEDDGEDSGLPVWLVAMVLVVLGVLMWSFEIDPVWILGIVGVLGISAFILMSGLSNLLLAGLLVPVALILYMGV